MKKIVVLTGAGVSAESGISTFRESGGLWEKYSIEEVATYKAWLKNRNLVLNFYNQRRKQLLEVNPNAAHYALAKLEEKYNVQIVTQNIDNLHERGGSTKILHLHGELMKARSTVDEDLIYDIKGWEINPGDKCEKGSQLRPHVVWFGEAVPNIVVAAEMTSAADILLVVGTSLVVYPAAGLVNYFPDKRPRYIIDPKANEMRMSPGWNIIAKPAGEGIPPLVEKLLAEA
jgi:NAD-dependent deacetylase